MAKSASKVARGNDLTLRWAPRDVGFGSSRNLPSPNEARYLGAPPDSKETENRLCALTDSSSPPLPHPMAVAQDATSVVSVKLSIGLAGAALLFPMS